MLEKYVANAPNAFVKKFINERYSLTFKEQIKKSILKYPFEIFYLVNVITNVAIVVTTEINDTQNAGL